MKRYLCAILTIFLLLVTAGCASLMGESAVLPPSRVGQSTSKAILGNRYTFETGYLESDVVARIKVGDWIAENVDLNSTYYEATVLECFKGDIPESFTLIQDGCSASTMKGYPLFTYGNELLLFLNKAGLTGYESPYWIIGSYTTVLDVSYDENGVRYYADRYGVLGETANVPTNYAHKSAVSNTIRSKIAENDPIIKEMHYSYPYIFVESDVLALFGKE